MEYVIGFIAGCIVTTIIGGAFIYYKMWTSEGDS